MQINGALVVVTGASRGLGASLAKELSRQKARVLLLARSAGDLEILKKQIESTGGQADIVSVDLSSPESVADVAKKILTDHGVPDIIINNAGAGSFKFITETSAAEMTQMMQLPFFAAFNLTREFLPAMLRRNSGMVVNISSPGAYMPWGGAAGYCIVRWTMRGFAQILKSELFGTGIRSCLVVPGEIQGTAYFDSNPGSRENMPMANVLYPTQTADQVAASVVKGIRRNKSEIIVPWLMKVTIHFDRIFPGIVGWIMHMADRKRVAAHRAKFL